MNKRWIALFLTLLVLVPASLLVSAQGNPDLTGTIRVGSWDSGDALEPFNKSIESFKALYPNVEVKLEAVPQEYGTKLLAQFAAGDAPDVFQIGDGDMAKYKALGASEPLDPFITGSNGLDPSVFYEGVANFGKLGGEMYYLTKDYSPLVLYYNKAHFEEAGIAEPTKSLTWDELLDIALTLTVDANGNNAKSDQFDETAIERWGIQIPDSWGDVLWMRGILPIIYQNGGTMIAEDGSTTKGHMNGEKTVQALQWYVDLFKKHHVAPSKEDIDAFAGVDLFQSGKVSMLWTGRWPLKDFIANTDLKFGTMPLPTGAAGQANVLCWAGFGIYSKSENKEAAWAFLKHIAAGEGAKEFANYALTSVRAVAEEQGLDKDPLNAPIMADLANVKQLPEASSPRWVECGEAAFKKNLETVFLQDVGVQEAMDKAAEDADACLAEQK
jgi:multiple sugar transport system substrate-binding protein